jgi:transposase InsO family protein
LGVSPAWFYKWRHGDASPRRARRRARSALIAALFAQHRGTYGAPRITADLREMGWRVCQNTVAELMAEQSLKARAKRRRRSTTRPGRGRWRAPDLVKRDFTARRINQCWFGDGTEIDTAEGKLRLASVLDVCSRRIVGFALSAHHDAALAYGSLAMAVAVRGGQVGEVVLHTDQGSRIQRRDVPHGLHTTGHPPIDGPTRIGAGQRGHRVVALHPGVRAALA